MSPNEIAALGLVETAHHIATGALTSVQVTRAMLDRVARLDGDLHSFVLVLEEEALAEAASRDRALAEGRRHGPLHGVPLAFKDILDLAGAATTVGFPSFRDRIAARDAWAVKRLRDAGAVILGKLQLTEGALGLHHPEVVAPVNPWRPDLWSGSSSSGSGVAVAAGLCYGSLGTDTGGSIRFPALTNALVGLKPTKGRVSRRGLFPLAETLDHIGPLARRVEDVAAPLMAIAGPDPEEPTSLPQPVPNYLAAAAAGVQGLRIGYDQSYCSRGVAPETSAAISHALALLERQGAVPLPVTLPDSAAAVASWAPMAAAEAASSQAQLRQERPQAYSAVYAGFLDYGAAVSGFDYARAHIASRRFAGALASLFGQVDALIVPMMRDPVYTLEAFAERCLEEGGIADITAMTCIYNLSGNPAITLPAGFSDQGLPLGFQLVGRHLEEATLLRLGLAYQDAMPPRPLPAL
ncbi:MAG: amidase [Pseudomonadota bacterium]